VNERLKILMQELGLTPAALSKIVGASDSTVRNYLYRDTKPGYEVLEKLYRSFRHINLPWLFGEPGSPLISEVAESGAVYQTNKKFKSSQVIGKVAGNSSQHQGSSNDQAAMQREIELLRSQLADKERTIQILMGRT
jgi:transcriptional regulator with XRE-family HTH domain